MRLRLLPYRRGILNRIRCSHALFGCLVVTGFLLYRFWMADNTYMESQENSVRSLQQLKEQALVDYLAAYLDVEYSVINNVRNANTYEGAFILTNRGSKSIDRSIPWSIYFYHLPRFSLSQDPYNREPKNAPKMAWRNVTLDKGRATIKHIQGNLYRLTPVFKEELGPMKTVTISFLSERWCAARTDMWPNWYIGAPNARDPAVLVCTKGETLDFVTSFEKAEQWKRNAKDSYHPWTAEQRFKKNAKVEHRAEVGLDTAVKIIPTPLVLSEKRQDGKDGGPVVLDPKIWYISASDKYNTEVALLAEALSLPVKKSDVPLERVMFEEDGSLGDEEYRITCTSRSIVITVSSRRAAFYAVISMQAAVNTHQKPAVIAQFDLHDKPRFPYRGLMVDVSRNFFSVTTMKRVLKLMADYKLNKLHFHLTDDEGWRLEIPGLPELTQIGARRVHDLSERSGILPMLGSGPHDNALGSGFYTVQDYQELLRYANDRHIEIIPEIDLPGHSHAAIKAMEARHGKQPHPDMLLSDPEDTSEYFSPQAFTDGVVNPCMQSTYTFVEHVLEALIKMHKEVQPLRVFHFGGDEVRMGAFLNSPQCQKYHQAHPELKDTASYKIHFVEKLGELLAQKGLELQGWNDGFNAEDRNPMPRSRLSKKDVYVNSWLNMERHDGISNTYKMANDGYKVILSYGTHLYLDHPQEPDPEERGLYWAARYIDTELIYKLITNNIYATEEYDLFGQPQPYNSDKVFKEQKRVPLKATENIVGISAQVWTETIRTEEQLMNMLLPRLLAVAERAWHKPVWENTDNLKTPIDGKLRDEGWSYFSNLLGAREVKRLADEGYNVYLPPPGARWKEGSSEVEVNNIIAGLPIQYSEDEGQTWHEIISNSVHINKRKALQLRTCSPSQDHRTSRFSRVVYLKA